MPRPKKQPKYSLHKASGQAVVRINGKDRYLGKHGTADSHAKYARLIGEWHVEQDDPVAQARSEISGAATPPSISEISVAEVLLAFWKHAVTHYVKNGEPTSELGLMKSTIELIDTYYGATRAADFGPTALKALRARMVERGYVRTSVNRRVGRVRTIFAWAAEEQLIACSVHHSLQVVRALDAGRSGAAESDRVRPADATSVTKVLGVVSRPVAAMIKLQLLTGMRPQEVVQVRGAEIDTAGDVWLYRPIVHKTQHHGRDREIAIGPRAQAVLAPFMDRSRSEYCFSPAEAEAERLARLSSEGETARKTPVYPSELRRRALRKAERKERRESEGTRIGKVYSPTTYRRAIARAIERLQLHDPNVEHWSPNQLRHSAATEIRRSFGLEGSQVVLGHSSAKTTEMYAERDLAKAVAIAAEFG